MIRDYIDIAKVYKLPTTNVVEIGSRDGHHAAQLAKALKVKSSQVYIFEPNPFQYLKIIKAYPKYEPKTYNYAIWNVVGAKEFHQVNPSKGNVGTSSLKDKVRESYAKIADLISVNCIRMDNFINDSSIKRIDICKVDVEGCTYEILDSFGDRLKNIVSLHIECEHLVIWKDQYLYEHVCDVLRRNDFVQVYFRLINGSQSDSIWIQSKYLPYTIN